MQLNHIAVNAVNIEEELEFLTGFLGLSLLQRWQDLRQAYVSFSGGPVIGVIENRAFDGSAKTMAHIAFCIGKDEFPGWVEKIRSAGIEIVAGPKPQRGGETILFRTPSKNIIELCYPEARETIGEQKY